MLNTFQNFTKQYRNPVCTVNCLGFYILYTISLFLYFSIISGRILLFKTSFKKDNNNKRIYPPLSSGTVIEIGKCDSEDWIQGEMKNITQHSHRHHD